MAGEEAKAAAGKSNGSGGGSAGVGELSGGHSGESVGGVAAGSSTTGGVATSGGGSASTRGGEGNRAGGAPGGGGPSGGAGGGAGNATGGTNSGGIGAGGNATGGTTAAGGTPTGGGASPGGGTATTAGGTATGGTAAGGAAGGTAAGGSGGTSATPCLDFGTPTQVGTIANSVLAGPSGIAASRAHPGVLYAHLDTGGTATVYVMTLEGTDLGQYLLGGATATDWEDMAVGPGPDGGTYLYLGDIGDNAARQGSGTVRTEIQVYRAPEPDVSTSQAVTQETLTDWQVLRFTYPDHAHDAETLMVDPVTGDLVIVTKESDGTAVVFRAPANTAADTPTVLEQVAVLQIGNAGQASQVSAGDISPNGDRFMVRTYSTILIWPRGASLAATFATEPQTQSFTTEPQGEGITFSADGTAWISAGEQARAIYQAIANCS